MNKEIQRLYQDLVTNEEKRAEILAAIKKPVISAFLEAVNAGGYEISEEDLKNCVKLPASEGNLESTFILVSQIIVA